MMTKNLQRTIKNTAAALTLAFGFLLLSNVTASAQYQNDDYYRREQQRQRQEERRERRDDRRDRRDDRRDRDDNNNNDGYYGNNNGGYGNRGYGSNNRNYNNVYRIAQQNGYNDGLRKGAEDARERHYNPQGTSEYKRATNGYNSSYGNKEGYKQAYRQAFLQGFDEGQNRYGNNGRYGNRSRNSNDAGSIFRRIITGN